MGDSSKKIRQKLKFSKPYSEGQPGLKGAPLSTLPANISLLTLTDAEAAEYNPLKVSMVYKAVCITCHKYLSDDWKSKAAANADRQPHANQNHYTDLEYKFIS